MEQVPKQRGEQERQIEREEDEEKNEEGKRAHAASEPTALRAAH